MNNIDPVKLTQDLIRCPSVTPKDEGAQDHLIKALKSLGFECHILKFGDVLNFFARRGTTSPHFCFCGHTDVVPSGDEESWTYPPFDALIVDNKIYGRGAVDMKSNIASFVSALSLFLKDNENFSGSISLLITGDEEAEAVNGTAKVLEWMKSTDNIPDVCLVGEPTSPKTLGEEIKIGRRGSLTGQIIVRGKQGHTGYPHLADNPIPKMAKLVDHLSSHMFDNGTEYFQPSALSFTTIDVGNKADNVIPEKVSAKFNIRFNDKWSAKTLQDKIVKILNEVALSYEIEFWSNAESFITKPGTLSDLVSSSVEKITGKKPKLSTAGGTSDARFVVNYSPVIECGLVGATCHQVDEHVDIDDIVALRDIYQLILKQYFLD